MFAKCLLNAQSRAAALPGSGVGGRGRKKMFHWASLRRRDHRQEWGGSDHTLLLECPGAGNNAFVLEQQDMQKSLLEK